MAAVGVALALGMMLIISHYRKPLEVNKPQQYLWWGLVRIPLAIIAFGLILYIITQVQFYRDAALGIQHLSQDQLEQSYLFATGERAPTFLLRDRVVQQLMFFPQVISIAAGAVLIGVAFIVWTNAKNRETGLGMSGNIMFSIFLMVGGWLCISELPNTIMMGGTAAIDTRDALVRTAMFSLGTVPVQLALGMLLAYLMFYEVTAGKGIYRLIYFMPYITPAVATATVFTVIFNSRDRSLGNEVLKLFGIGKQDWLQENTGIIRIFYAEVFGGNPEHIADVMQGPSLALFTIIMFNIWVYAGYNAVIFLAGLGAIPGELYEAAKVDGAGRWSAFRHITFPLLSPVTFFLSILAIIGTFRAFGSIFVLKAPDNDYADTFTIQMFQVLQRDSNRGYAAALAFVLFGVIMVLTMIQSRLSRDRVHYG